METIDLSLDGMGVQIDYTDGRTDRWEHIGASVAREIFHQAFKAPDLSKVGFLFKGRDF
jgi:hypothetical protein